MDYSKKGLTGGRPNATVSRQLMTGIGSTVGQMLDNGAARVARVNAPVPRVKPGSTMGAVDPRCVTPSDDTQEPAGSE